MKTLTPAFEQHLSSGVTSLSYCWKIIRTDGVVQGFTDHDCSLEVAGVVYEAASGFSAAQAQANLGLAVDSTEIDGVLTSETINEQDLAAGLYNNAVVETYWVNWKDTEIFTMVSKNYIGEVTRSGVMFTAEIRGLSNALQQKAGRKYQRYCQAVLGDSKCKIDLSLPAYQGTGAVTLSSSNRKLTVSGLDAFEDDWFSAGLLTWQTGANSGAKIEVKFNQNIDGVVTLDLWQAMPYDISPGDTFEITTGCKQDAQTCAEKFSNILNFRGFNLIPGADALLFYPKDDGTAHLGGSLFE